MPYLIGTDEAGYAPNLGPLVVSASVWRVDEVGAGLDLYKPLRSVVGKSASRDGRRLAIADSKALYSPATGLHDLERGVLTALAVVDRVPTDWLDAWKMLDPESLASVVEMPWHVDYNQPLPLAAELHDIERMAARARRGFEAGGVRLVGVQSRAVFPEQFNETTEVLGNKAEALSRITLGLVADLLPRCDGENVFVVCDKHGGRNYYGRLLQQQFPDPLVEVHGESSDESVYRWGPEGQRIEVRFRAGGESFLPAALASMISKYLRELAMRPFNEFWCGRVADLAPTAGYPRDARRFRAAIQPTQMALGIDDRVLWRFR
jgi:ribonuclease HII